MKVSRTKATSVDDRHRRSHHRIPQVRQSRRRVRHRGFSHHADDHGAVVHRHARGLALEHSLGGALASMFLIIDVAFFTSNLTKIAEGGYVPLLLAGCVYFIMVVWHLGAEAVAKREHETVMPIAPFMAKIKEGRIPRVPGTAVFLTRMRRDAPPVMIWHVKHNRALHERLFVLNVVTESVSWVRTADRLTVAEVAPNFWRARARYGFMERPDIPALLQQAHDTYGCNDITYYVGHETIVPREDDKALPRWLEALFAMMQRNSVHVSRFFRLPPEQVVEIGREISI
jgi:KUP system potassium uptake protein